MASWEKQQTIANKIKDKDFDALLITTLDDICWLTNLRGSDIAYNPVFFANALFYPGQIESQNALTIYTDMDRMSAISDYLGSQHIEVAPYDQIYTKLEELKGQGKKIGIHMDTCNADLHNFCGDLAVKTDNVIKDNKCKKSPAEMEGMR